MGGQQRICQFHGSDNCAAWHCCNQECTPIRCQLVCSNLTHTQLFATSPCNMILSLFPASTPMLRTCCYNMPLNSKDNASPFVFLSTAIVYVWSFLESSSFLSTSWAQRLLSLLSCRLRVYIDNVPVRDILTSFAQKISVVVPTTAASHNLRIAKLSDPQDGSATLQNIKLNSGRLHIPPPCTCPHDPIYSAWNWLFHEQETQ